jgi:hypothetical protein
MLNRSDLEVVTVLPWQDDEEALRGLRCSLQDFPLFAWTTSEQIRKVHSPVRIRLDSGGGFHLLGDVSGILHLDSGGRPIGRTPLPNRSGRIVDYACDPTRHCVLLEQFEDGGRQFNRLRRLDSSGVENWSRVGLTRQTDLDFDHLARSFSKLLLDEGRALYLPAERHGPDVAEIDPETGKTQRTLRQKEGAGIPFLANGRLYSVFFDPQTNRRGISVLDPNGRESSQLIDGSEHFAWLVYPFGVDNHSWLYTWRNGRVARLSAQGHIQELGRLDGFAVRALDRLAFTSHAGLDGIVVEGAGATITLSAPSDFRLVHVDGQGRYYLLGSERPDKPGELRVYSSGGLPESSTSPPENLHAIENRLPTYDAWQVDPQGRVTFTITMPEGVAIVRSRPPL